MNASPTAPLTGLPELTAASTVSFQSTPSTIDAQNATHTTVAIFPSSAP